MAVPGKQDPKSKVKSMSNGQGEGCAVKFREPCPPSICPVPEECPPEGRPPPGRPPEGRPPPGRPPAGVPPAGDDLFDMLKEIRNTLTKVPPFRQYYDTGLATISIATLTQPVNFDVIAAAGRPGYDVHAIFSILGRTAPALTVVNEPGSPLYVVVTSDGHSWAGEAVIEQGETMTFYNIWELRIRSPLANAQYRITEFKVLKPVTIEYFKGNPYISETSVANVGLANANIEDIKDGSSTINGAARDDTYQALRRNAHSGELANIGPGSLFIAFNDGSGYSNERSVPINFSQPLDGMDIAKLRIRTDAVNTQYKLAAQ